MHTLLHLQATLPHSTFAPCYAAWAARPPSNLPDTYTHAPLPHKGTYTHGPPGQPYPISLLVEAQQAVHSIVPHKGGAAQAWAPKVQPEHGTMICNMG